MGEQGHLVCVHGGPVIIEHAAGVTRIRVPGPEGPADALSADVVGELPKPSALHGVCADCLRAELAHQNRRSVGIDDVAEARVPSAIESSHNIG